MLKVRITVPAVCTGWGGALDSIGLALSVQETLEFSVRNDSRLSITVDGEGDRPATLRHPALRAALMVFQAQEQAPAGLGAVIRSRIPINSGLNDQSALIIGGLIGANNLLDTPFRREDLTRMACTITGQPAAPIAAMLGGLVISDGTGLHRRIDVPSALKAVIALPDLPDYADPIPSLPPIAVTEASHSAARTALTVEAFRTGDWPLLGQVLSDPTVEPARRALIPGAEEAARAAIDSGAIGVVLAGGSSALIAFSIINHKRIEDVMTQAFAQSSIRTRTWTFGVDSQGVTVSVSR